MSSALSPSERRAVEQHRQRLSDNAGHIIDFETALVNWEATCQVQWREQRQADCLRKQRVEIERHKWIESEKAQCDVGKSAALDWIAKYAATWRQWYEEHDAGNAY